MKELMVFIFVLLSLNESFAQDKKGTVLYLNVDRSSGELGNHGALEASLNYMFKDNYILSVGGSILRAKSKFIPNGYNVRSRNYDPISGTYGPQDYMNSLSITIGKILKANEKGDMRVIVAGGVAMSQLSLINFGIGGPDGYRFRSKTHNTLNLVLAPKLEYALTKYIGASVSPRVYMNHKRTYAGISLGLLIGKLY